ncbi:MAG: GGDEF domain-containing protein, partial [Alphaproteobacteria bacterium]|nr:GGDEF domain-containing protein [Alphaproteobacteria bacterium]
YKSAYTNTYNEVDGIITICVEITDRKIFENELRRLATVDPLTGCFNRRRFLELANMEFVRAERYNLSLCVMMLDIDHFKSINDTFGHAVGDEALIKLAKVVKGMIRDTDIFGRFGGEEFALLLPNTNLVDGQKIAERVREAIGGIKLSSNEDVICFTVSIGLTHYLVKMDDTISKALQRADEALYVAKKSGRNKVILSEASSNIETILQAAG